MNDALNIYKLYTESKLEHEQPTMTRDGRGNKHWRLHGKLHRKDAPAVEYASGTKEWYLHGSVHRKGGPAIEHANGTKSWWLHGFLHREDGAAVEGANGTKDWWLHDNYYPNAQSWAKALLKQRKQPHDDASIDAFLRTILQKDVDAAL